MQRGGAAALSPCGAAARRREWGLLVGGEGNWGFGPVRRRGRRGRVRRRLRRICLRTITDMWAFEASLQALPHLAVGRNEGVSFVGKMEGPLLSRGFFFCPVVEGDADGRQDSVGSRIGGRREGGCVRGSVMWRRVLFVLFVAACARGYSGSSARSPDEKRPSCGRAHEFCSHGLGLSKPNMAQTQLVFSFTSNDYLITESLRPCWATGNSEEHTHSINKATELLYVVLVSCTFSRYQIY